MATLPPLCIGASMPKRATLLTAALCALMPLLTACPSETAARAATPEEQKALGAAVNAFAVDVFKVVAAEEENKTRNLVISPYGMHVALSMVGAGARNATETEMEKMLRVNKMADSHHVHRTLYEALSAEQNGNRAISIHNSLWLNKEYPFDSAYVETVKAAYNAHTAEVDPDDPATRDMINAWIKKRSGIDGDAVGPLGPGTQLVAVNTTRFRGVWQEQFDTNETYTGRFRRADGKRVSTPMMRRHGVVYASVEDLHLQGGDWLSVAHIALPFAGERLWMVILAPAGHRQLHELESRLTADMLKPRPDVTRWRTLDSEWEWFTMPKFTMQTPVSDWADRLGKLGVESAIDSGADFSGMTTRSPPDLWISRITQRCRIEVDERGAEAAAETVVVMENSDDGPNETASWEQIDRPFVFAIVDLDTDAILFIGRVGDPRSEQAGP